MNEWMNEWMRTTNCLIHELLNKCIDEWDEDKKKLPTKKSVIWHNETWAENSIFLKFCLS